jgi:threonine synthase
MFTKIWQGFQQFERLGLIDSGRPKLIGGQAAGCAPVATAFEKGENVAPVRPNTVASSIAIGNPADGDLAVATARESGGGVYSVPEHEIGPNISLLAELGGIFGEGATGVALGALREAIRRGQLGESDRVVLLVTGTGLKTPQLAEASGDVVEIDPDVDALLDRLGVAA